MKENEIIEGERICLRTATGEDTDLLVKWRNSPHIAKNFLRKEPLTREIHENFRATEIAGGRAIQFIIVRKEDGKPIGSQYYLHIDPARQSAEFGIYIGEVTALGCGYGKEAAELAIRYAFKELRLREVLLRVREENQRAVSLYQNLGFSVCSETTVPDPEKDIRVLFMKKENDGLK